jgi:hypothetical protein
LGIRPPSFWNFCGSLRNSTISWSSVLGLLDAGDVLERDLLAGGVEQLGLALAEGEGLVAAGLHLAHEEDPQHHDEQDGGPGEEHGEERVVPRLLGLDHHVGPLEVLHQVGVFGQLHAELLSVRVLRPSAEGAGELLAADGHLRHLALLHLLHELGEVQLLLVGPPVLEGVPEQDHHHEDGHPQKQGLERGIQCVATSSGALRPERP